MSSVEVSKLSAQEVSQLACTYASLILHDDGQDVTAQKINTLIKAAGVKCESYWPKMFAKAISGNSLSNFFNFGGSAATSSAPSGATAKEDPKQTKKDQPKKDDKKAPPKAPQPPKEEEEDVGMGGLFD